jgi:MoaA/NifB/PqqE/SkfB family radical SAM enzyme
MNPSHVFLDVNLSCNLRCVQCAIHELHNPPESLTDEERVGVVRQVAQWDTNIPLVITGGEQLVARSALKAVADACKQSGVSATLSTNGTLITEADASWLANSGIRCVVVSFDSLRPEVHDRIRGVPGTWERALRGLRLLLKARDLAANGFTVLTSTILGRHNLHEMDAMTDWLWSLGIDNTLYQPLQPDFVRNMPSDWYLSSPLWPTDPQAINKGIDLLRKRKAAGARIYQAEPQFEDMRLYFHNPQGLPESICASLDNNLMIDVVGQIRFCFNMDQLGIPIAGNVRTHKLREVWSSRHTSASGMRACRKGCGSMICHAR